MSTVLITGGKVSEAINMASKLLNNGRKVVVFHEFPEPSATRFPNGVEMVFKLDPEGADVDEVASIYSADAIVDLDRTPQRQRAPQHLY